MKESVLLKIMEKMVIILREQKLAKKGTLAATHFLYEQSSKGSSLSVDNILLPKLRLFLSVNKTLLSKHSGAFQI